MYKQMRERDRHRQRHRQIHKQTETDLQVTAFPNRGPKVGSLWEQRQCPI